MEYARRPGTRKKMYVSGAYKLLKNVELSEDIAKCRQENTCLLSHASHASFRSETEVAKTLEFVKKILNGLEQALFPPAQEEAQLILERKKSYLIDNNDLTHEDDDTLNPWDTAFYNRLAKEGMQVSHEKISENFPLRQTVLAMLGVFASRMQFQFEPPSAEHVHGSTLHEDLEVWSVWDERKATRDKSIGYPYTDLLS